MFKSYEPPIMKKVKEMEARMELALRPIKQAEAIAQKNNQTIQWYENHLRRIESVRASVKRITEPSFPSPMLILNDYIYSYNQVKGLINSYNNNHNESDTNLRELEEFKREYGDMPDIDEMVGRLNPNQIENFETIIHQAAKEGTKKGIQEAQEEVNTTEHNVGKFIIAYELYKDIPQLVDATEKYYVAVKTIVKLFGI
ncbi:hypothetical protein SAMN05421743_12151 [Thalassobacillus cyri]|uniref:Uncharacterized protein n=1 Tax=Thalassobacillus cyri TaxID=571932 RepID=A0A1H4H203_9BACI|nr:hypothetical protein [Thalassobacillus cyri]SEB15833.1 hypothetical protein SAMN05421743_12151 [Thalassobacillus cyri]